MNTYFFEDLTTSEEFFVEADSLKDAQEIANTYFEEPNFISKVTAEFAEMVGLDTYQVSNTKRTYVRARPVPRTLTH